MKAFLLGGVAAAILVGSAPAVAQTGVVQNQLAPKALTRAQAAAKIKARFAILDTNFDGVITQTEVQAARADRGQRPARFAQRTQRQADPARRFARLDANSDGQISRAEFNSAYAADAQRQAANPNRRMVRAPGRRGITGMRPVHSRMGGQMFVMADVNKDGRVTLQEAQASALRRFDMIDANRDGQITMEERRQMRMQQMRGRIQG